MQLTFIDRSEQRYVVVADRGMSVMQAAVENLVPGILGDCGGACACATCHVHVDPGWMDLAGPPSEIEAQLLDGVLDLRPTSRLACQIVVNDSLDGLVVHLPESQI